MFAFLSFSITLVLLVTVIVAYPTGNVYDVSRNGYGLPPTNGYVAPDLDDYPTGNGYGLPPTSYGYPANGYGAPDMDDYDEAADAMDDLLPLLGAAPHGGMTGASQPAPIVALVPNYVPTIVETPEEAALKKIMKKNKLKF